MIKTTQERLLRAAERKAMNENWMAGCFTAISDILDGRGDREELAFYRRDYALAYRRWMAWDRKLHRLEDLYRQEEHAKTYYPLTNHEAHRQLEENPDKAAYQNVAERRSLD